MISAPLSNLLRQSVLAWVAFSPAPSAWATLAGSTWSGRRWSHPPPGQQAGTRSQGQRRQAQRVNVQGRLLNQAAEGRHVRKTK